MFNRLKHVHNHGKVLGQRIGRDICIKMLLNLCYIIPSILSRKSERQLAITDVRSSAETKNSNTKVKKNSS